MMAKSVATVVLVLALSTVATFLNYSVETPTSSVEERRLASTGGELESSNALPKYDQSSIEGLLRDTPYPHSFHTSLLVFDGKDFLSYDLRNKDATIRSVKLIPFLVHALRSNFPHRFQPGQPVFQLPWTVNDFLSTACVNDDQKCMTKDLPPIVSFGSMYKDEQILPTAKGFPNPYMLGCLYAYKFEGATSCHWADIDESLAWDDLISTIIWRGTDFRHFTHSYNEHSEYAKPWVRDIFTQAFVAANSKFDILDRFYLDFHHLTPRWRAAIFSTKTKVLGGHNWIDCMFTGNWNQEEHAIFAENDIPVADTKHMSEFDMSRYRYQIDLGGGGGTTWKGTLAKMQMPGVLFHHETKTKDWFYDLMEPWKHYIPVKEDLSDLWDSYLWAEANPEKVKKIAEEATKLSKDLLSSEYMDKLYDEFFVDYLGKVVDAYQPEDGKSWNDCVQRYENNKVSIHLMSRCDEVECKTEWDGNRFLTIKHDTKA